MSRIPFRVEGIDYSPGGIEALRQELITMRGEAMGRTEWDVVIVLSHTIALLAYLIEVQGFLAIIGDLVFKSDGSGFNPFEWWEKWHPDKAPGKGRPKATGGKAGTGKAPKIDPNPHNRKKGGDGKRSKGR